MTDRPCCQLDTKHKLLVLVTDQFNCERLINAGRRLADRHHADMVVVNVSRAPDLGNLEALEFLYQTSKLNGALMEVHYDNDPPRYLEQLIKKQSPSIVVTGMPQQEGSLLQKLWIRFNDTDFYLVTPEGVEQPVTHRDWLRGCPDLDRIVST